MRYDGWKEISGVRFSTHRVSYLSGLKRGEITAADVHVNAGLKAPDLAAKPSDFAPQLPGRT
jgi:hypothetical protein